MAEPQTFANHRHRAPGWLLTALCAVFAFVLAVLLLLRVPRSINALALLLVTIAVLGLVAMIRRYATRLQDRIIRLEMRLVICWEGDVKVFFLAGFQTDQFFFEARNKAFAAQD